jgi:hypothetical protein
MWWCIPVIPAIREVEIAELQPEDFLGKKLARPYFNKHACVVAYACDPRGRSSVV